MELGRAFLHGLLGIQHEGQHVVLHLQRPHALIGSHLVLRDDHRHVVAPIAHVPVQQVPVRHVLVPRVHGPGMARRGERNVRHVEARQHLHHAGDGLRRRLVHRLHHTVGDVGVLNAHVQRIRRHPVLIVLGAPGGLVKGVYSDFALTYVAHVALPPLEDGNNYP